MSYKIISTPIFERELKRLSKKYISLKSDLASLAKLLIDNPQEGTPLGNNSFKIRLAISSKNRGKSGGARVITCVKIMDEKVYLVSIYDKSETDTITDEELLRRTKDI